MLAFVTDMAGFNSSREMIGKTDADMPWQGNDGNERRRLIDDMAKRKGAMTITNWALTQYGWRCFVMDQKVIFSGGTPLFQFQAIETTALCSYRHWVARIDSEAGILHLGPEFNNRHLTDQETQVLRLRSLGATHAEMERRTLLSQRQIRSFIERWNLWTAEANYQARSTSGEPVDVVHDTELSTFLLDSVDWFIAG